MRTRPNNLPTLIDVFKELRPKVGPELEKDISDLQDGKEKADCFFEQFKTSFKNKKGEFAQALAIKIQNGAEFSVPNYIKDAIEHVSR